MNVSQRTFSQSEPQKFFVRNPHVLLSFSLPVQVAETLQKSSSGIDKLLENLKGRMTQRILQNDAFKLWTPQPDVTEKVVVLRHVLL
jgi:hypothetical protein